MAEPWGAILEAAIQACGDSQAELARQLERSPSVVGNWRMGRYKPDYESCLAIAEITHRSPEAVLIAAGHDPARLRVVRDSDEPDPDDAELSGRKFAAALRGVPRSFWPSVVEAVVALANSFAHVSAEAPVNDQIEPPVNDRRSRSNDRRKNPPNGLKTPQGVAVLQLLAR